MNDKYSIQNINILNLLTYFYILKHISKVWHLVFLLSVLKILGKPGKAREICGWSRVDTLYFGFVCGATVILCTWIQLIRPRPRA